MQTYREDLLLEIGATSFRRDVILRNSDLFLREVTVTARQSGRQRLPTPTYVIDRIAVEQAQAYTLGDLLQLIPGQSVSNPLLQGSPIYQFPGGIPGQRLHPVHQQQCLRHRIFVNDANLNNNANMQGYNPVYQQRIPFRSALPASVTNSFQTGDAPGGGFDLRELPVGDIERVEVVQGIASARYGDILEGGIFIETVAGRSPVNLNVRRAAGNTNFGINRGFQLHPRHCGESELRLPVQQRRPARPGEVVQSRDRFPSMDILLRGGTADPKTPFRSPTAPTWTISALIRTSAPNNGFIIRTPVSPSPTASRYSQPACCSTT